MTGIKDAIQKIAWAGTTSPTTAKVLAVNKEDNTITVFVEETGVTIPDVMLLCLVDNPAGKFVIYPETSTDEQDSIVSIDFLNDDENTPIVTKVHHVAEILLHGDAFGGLVKASVLKTEIDKLRGYSSALKAATKTALLALDTLLPGTSEVFEAAMTGHSTGDLSDITNPSVKHG